MIRTQLIFESAVKCRRHCNSSETNHECHELNMKSIQLGVHGCPLGGGGRKMGSLSPRQYGCNTTELNIEKNCLILKNEVRVGFELSEEFLAQVGVHQGSVLSPLLFAIAVDLISENAKEELMNEILYADDLVLMSESIQNLKEKFSKWKEVKGESQESQSNDE